MVLAASTSAVGASWSPATLLNTPAESAGQIKNPRLVASIDGGFHAAYTLLGLGEVKVQYRRFDGQSLGPSVTVFGANFNANAQLAEAMNGDVHIVYENWIGGPEVGWAYSTNGGQSFSSPTIISQNSGQEAKHPLISPYGPEGSNTMVASYWDSGNGAIRAMTFNGASWTPDTCICVVGGSEYEVLGITRSPFDGSVWRAFDDGDYLAVRRFDGTSWGPTQRIANTGFFARLTMAANESGQVMVVWDKDEGGHYSLYTPNVGWSAPQRVYDRAYFGGVTAIPGTNDFYMVNAGENVEGVHGRRFSNGQWGAEELVGVGQAGDFTPHAKVSAGPDGTLYAVWEYWGSGDPEAYFSVLSNVPPFFAPGQQWKYLDTGVDPGSDWKSETYDDSAWSNGRAQLGYGDGDEATTINFGPDPLNRHVTTYFRHAFDVDDPASINYLKLGLLRDDGAAVYLNGIEIVRDNLAPGAGHGTYAPVAVAGAAESTYYNFRVDPSLLKPGRNVLAVEVHQSAPNSSDLSFDLQMDADLVDPATGTLVPQGAMWQYLDNGSDQGVAWRDPQYDDRAWAFGKAQFGYGDGDEATVVSFGPNTSNKYPTTYFRRTFNVADPDAFDLLMLSILRDDGAAVYLNGVEIARDGLPVGAAYNTYATQTLAGGDETRFIHFAVDPSLLVVGQNVIAVEVHQVNATSSDLSFDLTLRGDFADPDPSVLVPAGAMWLYLDNGTDQGAAWRAADFDDRNWSLGEAQLGYGDGDEATVISFGSNASAKFPTTYFRRSFFIDDPTLIEQLTLHLLRDDGAAVYLNGVEIARDNLAPGAAYNAFALGATPDETTFFQFDVSPSLLVAGENVLAVEIHQATAGSSDLSFDLMLTAALRAFDPGDINMDGVIDAIDIDLLFESPIDLNGDGTGDALDIAHLVETILGTTFGDANLDRRVAIDDLARVATNFGTFGPAIGWADGDFDGNRMVNITDLAALAVRFGFDASAPGRSAAIPEPASTGVLLVGLSIGWRRGPRHEVPRR